MSRPAAAQSLRRIFAAPAAIALLSIVGLVAALLGDGVYDILSWIGLLVPVLAIAWALRFRRG
ncbi:hypothetical protein STVA_35270 [Allostella vacuolata]|nr:hypothetical protein STVA_35270 [Stella vacuolata]